MRVLVILYQNVPHTSRNKRRDNLMMIMRVNLMMKLLSILMPSLIDVNLIKILIMEMSLMKNCLIPTKSFVP